MTSQPRGIRRILSGRADLTAWRRRVLQALGVWLALVLAAAALGLAPDVAQLGAVIIAAAVLAWYLVDHAAANHVATWPLTDLTERGGQRGGDYRATNLAGRLEAADVRGEGRAHLTQQLHHELSAIIGERLYAKHGITIDEEPRWAEAVMPPELWDFVTGLPDPALYSPAKLDPFLRRIEQW